jgi:hypothetical protein
MHLEFKKLGLNENQIKQMEGYGIRYSKSQKKNMLKLFNLEKPTDSILTSFQDKYGKLPTEYILFSKENNGGTPSKSVIRNNNKEIVIDRFLCISTDESIYDSINNYLKTYKNRIPKSTLPIGTSPGGDIVLLDVSEQNYGRILYWEHENEAAGDGNNFYENITILAESFGLLLGNLES